MSSHDPLQKKKRLWNETENILGNSLAGTLILHQNLNYLDSCKAVVRQDLDKLNGKVKLIGGGVIIEGLNYAGFVGSGMLTAAILSLCSNSSSIPTSDSIIECIDYAFQEQQKSDGILLLVHDCAEYFLNFLEAKSILESKGIPIKVIYVKDQVNDKFSQKMLSSPRSPSGLLFIYKIAGAMSEDGNSLDEIYNTCSKIITNKAIFSTGVYISECSSNEAATIKISRGDILSDRNAKLISMANTSTREIIKFLIQNMIDNNSCNFSQGSKLAILIDYFGGFCELEANIVIKELVQQLSALKFQVKNIYTGTFHVSLDLKGFHLSILNLSNNLKFPYYLSVPTSAYSWPKTNSTEISLQMLKTNTKKKTAHSKTEKSNEDLKPSWEVISRKVIHETDILLAAIEFACEALMACSEKIDMLDKSKISQQVEKCGTRLASIAESIIKAIRANNFVSLSISSIFFRLAVEFEKNIQDPQAELYKFFLSSLGKELENKVRLDASDWLDAFVRSIKLIDSVAKGTKFSDTFNAAKSSFCNAFTEDDDVIRALEQAVNAAQKQTAHVMLESGKVPSNQIDEKDCGFVGLAGAHAIGVWMRGAYEGIKLKSQNFQNKQTQRSANFTSDQVVSKKFKSCQDGSI